MMSSEGEQRKRRIRLVSEISEISSELENLPPPCDTLACQFVAFVSGKNKSGDLGGLSKRFSDPVASLTLLGGSEIVSVNTGNRKIQRHSVPIRSVKGGFYDYVGSLGVLLDDGTFLVGGSSAGDRWGRGNLKNFATILGLRFKKISAGSDHFLMLDEAGTAFSVMAKGDYSRNYGQLGTGYAENHYEPVEIVGMPKIRKIRAGYRTSSFVDERGSLWICGGSGYGQNGYFPFQGEFKKPTRIAGGIRNVFSGFYSFTTFIQKTNGKVLAGGFNDSGQCGVGFATTLGPYNLARWTEIKFEGRNPLEKGELRKVSCSYNASFLLTSDGSIFSCGRKSENGFNNRKAKFTKLEMFAARGERVLDFACGVQTTVFLTDSGRIYMTGDRRDSNIRDTLNRFGRRVPNSNGEELWEVSWSREEDRETLAKKIERGGRFKISVWQGNAAEIFVTERVSKETVKKHREFLRMEFGEKMYELAREIEEMELRNRELANKVEETARKNKKLSKKIRAMKRDGGKGTDLLAILRLLDACLAPLNSVSDLEKFLHFIDFSGEREDKVFEFYEKSRRVFESREQRAAVEKITDILRIYKALKEAPQTRKHFEFPNRGIRFEEIDRVYSDFVRCLSLSSRMRNRDPKIVSEVSTLLVEIFRYFGVMDFDLGSLVSLISSLEDSFEKELRRMRRKLARDLKESHPRVLEFPPDNGASEDEFQKYLESFGDDVTFFDKVSFLVMEIVIEFAASFSRKISKAKKVLNDAIVAISELHWDELRSGSSDPRGNESTVTELWGSLKSAYNEVVKVDKLLAHSESRNKRKKYLRRLNDLQANLQGAFIAFLRHKIQKAKPSDEEILTELFALFKRLGIVKGRTSNEKLVDALKEEFEFGLNELRLYLSETPKESSSGFTVIGFRNSVTKKLFYDSTGSLEGEYAKRPAVEGHKGKPLSIFVKFYTREEIQTKSIQIKFVHLFSGESLCFNQPGCRDTIPLAIRKLQDWNTFEITIQDLRYSGEFALVVGLRLDPSKHQRFLHRRIFNHFPQKTNIWDL